MSKRYVIFREGTSIKVKGILDGRKGLEEVGGRGCSIYGCDRDQKDNVQLVVVTKYLGKNKTFYAVPMCQDHSSKPLEMVLSDVKALVV